MADERILSTTPIVITGRLTSQQPLKVVKVRWGRVTIESGSGDRVTVRAGQTLVVNGEYKIDPDDGS